MNRYKLHSASALSLAAGLALSACGGDADPVEAPGKVDISASTTEVKAAFDVPQQLQLTVKNTGPVAVSQLTPKPSNAMMAEVANTCAGIVLEVNASCTLSYRVKPTEPGQGSLGMELQFSHGGVTEKGSVSVPYNFLPSQWLDVQAWGNFQGNASHTGYVPVSLQAANFKLDWERAPERTDLAWVGMTSDKDRIYATVRRETPVAPGSFTKQYVVSALSMQDGGVAWQRVNEDILGAPAVLGEELFVSAPLPLNNNIWHLDAKTGEFLNKEPYGDARVETGVDPVIWGQGRYYATLGTYRRVWAKVLAGDTQNWTKPWAYTPASDISYLSVDAQYVYWVGSYLYSPGSFGSPDVYKRGLVAVDRLTGQEVFHIEILGDVPASSATTGSYSYTPVLDESSTHAFVSTAGGAMAMDLQRREIIWKVPGYAGTLSYAEQTVFTVSTDGRQLSALDARTGAVLWSWQAPAAISSDIVVTKTHLFVATPSMTYAINRASHQQEWSHPAGGRLLLSNAGKLIIAADNGKVSAIALR